MKKLLMFLFIILLLGALNSCYSTSYIPLDANGKEVIATSSIMIIESSPKAFIVDSDTKVVYIKFSIKGIAPYISENGKFCRYIDGKIVEID